MASSSALSGDRTRRSNPMTLLLQRLWGALKFVLFIALVGIIGVQLTTPSLSFSADTNAEGYRESTDPQWYDVIDQSGSIWKAYRTSLTTRDRRHVQVDYFAPQNIGNGPAPLTIIVSGFTTPEWLLEKVKPRGYSAAVIYRSPRLNAIMRNYWPTFDQVTAVNSWASFWELLATNPINKMYNMHAMLHEAPSDIIDIVRWGRQHIQTDVGRLNLIGLGSGALVSAAAAHQMTLLGMPPRTLSLVYPPGNLASAIKDNLIGWPNWLRGPMAELLAIIYFRLDLESHLPYVNTGTARLLVIPVNAFELANYAAEPTIGLSYGKTTIERLDVAYTGYYTNNNTNRIRTIIGEWLTKEGAIPSY